MTKSELIDNLSKDLSQEQSNLKSQDIELAVKCILEHMSQALASGDRIEIRGFGSFSLHFRPPRTGRNPKTGEPVELEGKYVPHFKPGKDLRDRVNRNFQPPEPDPVVKVVARVGVTDKQRIVSMPKFRIKTGKNPIF